MLALYCPDVEIVSNPDGLGDQATDGPADHQGERPAEEIPQQGGVPRRYQTGWHILSFSESFYQCSSFSSVSISVAHFPSVSISVAHFPSVSISVAHFSECFYQCWTSWILIH